MATDLQAAAAYATIGLGASQALVPQAAAKVFGLDPLDDQAEWLARLLGAANITLGAMYFNSELRKQGKGYRLGLLAANAGLTALSAAKGGLPKRTALSVVAFVAALVPAALQD